MKTAGPFEEKLKGLSVGECRVGNHWEVQRPMGSNRLNHRQPLPLTKVYADSVILGDSCSVNFLCDKCYQILGDLHEVPVIRVGLVELQHGELGVVLCAY